MDMRSDTSAIVTSSRNLSSFRRRLIAKLSHFAVDIKSLGRFSLLDDAEFSASVIGPRDKNVRSVLFYCFIIVCYDITYDSTMYYSTSR